MICRKLNSQPLKISPTPFFSGLPKAAVIKHRRQILVAMSLSDIAGITSSDVVYTYLPLYHAIGLQLAMGTTIFAGATNVVRKKFSASNFWRDCGRHGVTVRKSCIPIDIGKFSNAA